MFEDCDTVEAVLLQLAGFASLCWEPKPTGVFDPESAIGVAAAAQERVRHLIGESIARDIESLPTDHRTSGSQVRGRVTATRRWAYLRAADIARGERVYP